MVLVVVRGDQTFFNGYGETAPGSRELPTQDSVVRLCSLTKTFTTDVLTKLVADKKRCGSMTRCSATHPRAPSCRSAFDPLRSPISPHTPLDCRASWELPPQARHTSHSPITAHGGAGYRTSVFAVFLATLLSIRMWGSISSAMLCSPPRTNNTPRCWPRAHSTRFTCSKPRSFLVWSNAAACSWALVMREPVLRRKRPREALACTPRLAI